MTKINLYMFRHRDLILRIVFQIKRMQSQNAKMLCMYNFDSKDTLRMAPRCRNIYGINNCRKFDFIK